MHQTILDRVVFRNCSLSSDRRVRLRVLKSANDSLMESYRTNNVRVDYSCTETQNAYLVRYFPIHTNLIGSVFKAIDFKDKPLFDNSANVQVSLIGCGPCPEVVGIMDYLSNRHSDLRPVFHAFDLIDLDWQNNRKHVIDSTITGICPEINGHTFDLCQKNAVDPHDNTFASSQLIVMQNCLNELAITTFSSVFENLKHVLSLMPIGSRFIAIDIINYPMSLKVLAELQAYARNCKNLEVELEYGRRSIDDMNSYVDYPCELSEAQITKKRNTNFVQLVIRKIS